MSKRHLSQQQSQRIRRLQDRRIREARESQDIDESRLGPAEEGLVISHFGTQVEVEQAGIPGMIPPEACHLGWQESLALLAQLVEAEIPG